MKIEVFIEDEGGSTDKNCFDEQTLEYIKTVTISRPYPYPYGLIPDTKSGDGDNLDCFVVTQRPLKSKERVTVEPVGMMEQFEDGEEDHKILAVFPDEEIEVTNEVRTAIADFVTNAFKHLKGKQLRVGNFYGKEKAEELVTDSKIKDKRPKVLILTGPGGAGKSTIAQLVAERCGYEYLDGDNEDTEFFPNGDQWLPENTEQLKKAHEKILNKTKALVDQGKSVIVDYIIFGRYLEFVDRFRKEFGDDVQVNVLFPSQSKLIKRDKERENWTTGAERIAAVSQEFLAIKDEIGAENFIDTSGQTAEETFRIIRNTWF